MDFQVCKFRVGSFNYPMNKMVFYNELIPADTIIKSILDYKYVYAFKDLLLSRQCYEEVNIVLSVREGLKK